MIPYTDPDYFYNDAIHKALLITDGTVTVSGTTYTVTGQTVKIENDLLDQEGFELHQSLCSENQIRFGACESNYITFVMHENIPTLKGKVLKVYLIPDSDASKMLQIGVFKVSEDKLSSDRTKRTITAYDAMYDILNADVAAWYNAELPNTSTTKTWAQLRASFVSYFGLTAESATLVNDARVSTRTIDPQTLSGKQMLEWLFEPQGCFGKITNEGKFRFVELSPGIDDGLFPSETLYPSDTLYPEDVNPNVTPMSKARYIDVQFEDYNSESITQVTIRSDEDDVGVTVGTSGNRYTITGNPLMFGYSAADLTTVATNLLSKITNRYYKPCTVNAVGNPLFEPGDPIRVATTYRGIVTYILQRTMRGIQALRDTYTASGEQTISGELNSIGSQFKQLANKTMSIKADVDGLGVYVEEQLDTSVVGSYANVTATQIALKVSKSNLVDDLDDEMSGITVTSNRITFGSSGSLVINTANLELDANGNATFKGTVNGATIQSSTITSQATRNGVLYTASLADGIFESYDQNYQHSVNIALGEISLVGNGSYTTIAAGSIKVGGYDVLTTNSNIPIPTTIAVETIQNTSNNDRIRIDASGSAYNLVLNGSVNIGNGSSNTIRIKGKDVKWVTETINGTSYKILVEDA